MFQIDFQKTTDDQLFQGFYYTPVVEPQHPGAVLTENMYEAYLNGHSVNVPFMTGICSEENIGSALGSKSFFSTLVNLILYLQTYIYNNKFWYFKFL